MTVIVLKDPYKNLCTMSKSMGRRLFDSLKSKEFREYLMR